MKLTIEEIKITIEDFLYVETKDQRVVPFILNEIQAMFMKLLEKITSAGKPIRLIILKGRQFGFSTLILAILFIKCLLIENTRAVVISHDIESTKKLWRRVRFFAKTMCLPPTLDKESEHEFSFPKTNSYFYIGTAGAKVFGRGDNLTDVHCSEVAFWANAATIMNGLIQAVGMTGNIIIETTANGVGTYFQRLWKKSYKNAKSAWKAIFFKWTMFKEYELKPEPGFKRTPQENLICSLHPEMTDRKLAWRRFKIQEIETEPGMTPEQVFQQEYPLTPREAFISSGQSVFSLAALESYKPRAVIDEESGFKVWKRPSGYSIMAIDVAEGLENKDRTIIDIYDEKLEQVAQWAGWCDTDEAAAKAIEWATRYDSYVICEINNMGIAVVNILRKKYPIAKQYHREVFDEISKTKVQKLGWRTTGKTKPILVGALASEIRGHGILFNCPETIDECQSFVKDGSGGYEADVGANDDRVMTAGLALQAFRDRPPAREFTPQEQEARALEYKNKEWRKKHAKKAKIRKLMNNYAKK